MSSLNVEILNPKAKKLLQDLEDLKLISIKKPGENPFLSVVKRIRSRRAQISLEDITKEVETVRTKRYGKKA
jgi:replication-associated recombination protein RarA